MRRRLARRPKPASDCHQTASGGPSSFFEGTATRLSRSWRTKRHLWRRTTSSRYLLSARHRLFRVTPSTSRRQARRNARPAATALRIPALMGRCDGLCLPTWGRAHSHFQAISLSVARPEFLPISNPKSKPQTQLSAGMIPQATSFRRHAEHRSVCVPVIISRDITWRSASSFGHRNNQIIRQTLRECAAGLACSPHRSQTFKPSSDPLFVDKVRDIVGLYLSHRTEPSS
jgi:hypothetical protein